MKMKMGWLKKISNILFVLTIGFTLYILVDFFITRGSLPPGVCPIENKRPLMYIAAALALVSFIIAMVEDRIKGE
ncbi:MAG: hypothetical protein ACOX77_04770 [Caldicoprobacterales bacterium]|jgi:hypothetical protein